MNTPHDPMSGSARWAGLVLAEAAARYGMASSPFLPLTEEQMSKYPTSCAKDGARILGTLLMALPGHDEQYSAERAAICYHAGCLTSMLLTYEKELWDRQQAAPWPPPAVEPVEIIQKGETVDYSKEHRAVLMEGPMWSYTQELTRKRIGFSAMCMETHKVAGGSYRLAREKNLIRIALQRIDNLCGGKHYL